MTKNPRAVACKNSAYPQRISKSSEGDLLGNYSINMYKIVFFMTAGITLAGCSILPGMHNLDTTRLKKTMVQERIQVNPVLIPITPSLIANQKVSTYHYRIAPSDILSINVWQHPEFDFSSSLYATPIGGPANAGSQANVGQSTYLVNADGYIYFPLIGYVHVADKTIEETRHLLTVRLRKYVPNPQINIRIDEYRGQKIYVLGDIEKPGSLLINDQKMTIADALAQAGWMDLASADPGHIYVIRGNYTQPQIFWLNLRTPDKFLLAESFSMQPKDILFVSSAPIARWNRVWSQILPTIQSIWFTQSIIRNS